MFPNFLGSEIARVIFASDFGIESHGEQPLRAQEAQSSHRSKHVGPGIRHAAQPGACRYAEGKGLP
jgi:hypothetical protein